MKKQNEKEVVLTIVVGLLVLFYFTKNNYLLIASIIIGLLGVFSDIFANKLSWAWLKLAHIMGSIMSPLLLGAVFFVFLTPIAFLQKMLSKNDNLKMQNPKDTVFVTRDHQYKASDIENLW